MLLHLFISGVLGTLIMTLFTYAVELVTGKELSEPELLNHLICKCERIGLQTGASHFLGWLIHFAIGILFAAGMIAFIEVTGFEPTIYLGLLLGAALGLVGVIGWYVLFTLHHNPPQIDFPLFLTQLIMAHSAFGLVLVIYMQLFRLY